MPIERLSAEDQMMRRLDEVWPQDNGALLVLDGKSLFDAGGRFRYTAACDFIQARLHLVPRFRQIILATRRGLGDPAWVDAPGFELAEHVHVRPIPAPAGEAGLLRLVEELRREPLPPHRPLWGMWFLTGLPERRVAVFAKVNHAVADGMAMMGAVSAFLATSPAPRDAAAPAWHPSPAPSTAALAADRWRRTLRALIRPLRALLHPKGTALRLAATLTAVRDLLADSPPPSSLDRFAGRRRRLVLVRSSLERFKAIAHAHAVPVNDVLLAIIAGGLRALLESRGELAPSFTVRAYVPVSLRPRGEGGAVQGNRVAEMVVPIPVAISGEPALVRAISIETRRRKARAHLTLTGFLRWSVLRWALMKLLDRQRVNVTTANLPGPAWTLSFAGARVLEVFPVLPLIGKAALGIAAVSYSGAFNLGIVADEDAYPDLDVFVAGVERELSELVRTPRPSARAQAVSPAGAPPRRELEPQPERSP